MDVIEEFGGFDSDDEQEGRAGTGVKRRERR
jgi:hypothetical protein